MQSIIDNINSLESAFTSFFSILPGGWGALIATAVLLVFAYTVMKVILDVIGTFF